MLSYYNFWKLLLFIYKGSIFVFVLNRVFKLACKKDQVKFSDM